MAKLDSKNVKPTQNSTQQSLIREIFIKYKIIETPTNTFYNKPDSEKSICPGQMNHNSTHEYTLVKLNPESNSN